ncbi:initiation-specific alpha-1-6-mannosyltransferase [Apiospora kogelbergensis]
MDMLKQLQGNALPPVWRKPRNAIVLCASLLLLSVLFLYKPSHHHFPTTTPPSTPTPAGSLVARKIWQIFFPQKGAAEQYVANPELRDTATWIGMNPGYQYRLVGRQWADDYVERHFADDKALLETYRSLTQHGLKSDILRYLLLAREGAFQQRTRVVVGIEFDQLNGPNWVEIPHALQFCQWTIASAPGHSLFRAMVDRAVQSLQELATLHNTTLARLKPTNFETVNSTGPAAWTDVVFEHLQRADPLITNLRDLSGMKEPRLIGDILVLPIDGFGMGQSHSGATNDGSIPDGAMLKHLFRGSWRGST